MTERSVKLKRDTVAVGILALILAILSYTSILMVRIGSDNRKSLDLINRCVLPEGDLCRGNTDGTAKIVDEIVRRINEHTDQVVGGNG